mgnify:FL=1
MTGVKPHDPSVVNRVAKRAAGALSYWDLLDGFGYRLFRVLPSSRLLPIVGYYEDCEHFRGVTNYLAVLDR